MNNNSNLTNPYSSTNNQQIPPTQQPQQYPQQTPPTQQPQQYPKQIPNFNSYQQQMPQPLNQNLQQQSPKKAKKKKNTLAIFLMLIILILGGYIVYMNQLHQQQLYQKEIECTPVSTKNGTKNLPLNSTIVKDLYAKVLTNIREDLALTELNDSMKRYLAYRQIPQDKIYESGCNLFSSTKMEPYTCQETSTFNPHAFKEETLQLELKKLFGEKTNIPNENIQLGTNCIGGYQYIEERGEYVQGFCNEIKAPLYSVTKKLVKATSTESTITLNEEVKYRSGQGLELPENLKSGTYIYTFQLDTNYNYVYTGKTLQQ